MSGRDTLVPDTSVVARSRLNPEEDQYIQGSPDIAIEVVSPFDTAKHLKRKVGAYLEGGSKSVWVVYPDAKSVELHSVDSMREFRGDQTIEDPVLPGFSAPVASFFEIS